MPLKIFPVMETFFLKYLSEKVIINPFTVASIPSDLSIIDKRQKF